VLASGVSGGLTRSKRKGSRAMAANLRRPIPRCQATSYASWRREALKCPSLSGRRYASVLCTTFSAREGSGNVLRPWPDGTETKAAALRASPVSASAGVAASLPGKSGQGCGGEPSAGSRGEMKRPALDSRVERACALRGDWPCGSSPLPAAARVRAPERTNGEHRRPPTGRARLPPDGLFAAALGERP
jgi:hypothetical protein